MSPQEQIDIILRDLPPQTDVSKLEPYKELIRTLRQKRVTYARIAAVLRERCGLAVATSTVHNFVKVRAKRRSVITMLPDEPLPPTVAVSPPSAMQAPPRTRYRFNVDA